MAQDRTRVIYTKHELYFSALGEADVHVSRGFCFVQFNEAPKIEKFERFDVNLIQKYQKIKNDLIQRSPGLT